MKANGKGEKKKRAVEGRISIFEQAFGSGGTIENSPAFQCPGQVEKTPPTGGSSAVGATYL
jgi:hypothetical protein